MEVKLVRGEKSILKELQCILSKEDHDKYEWTKIMPIVGYAEKQNMVKDVAEKVLSWIWSFDYFFLTLLRNHWNDGSSMINHWFCILRLLLLYTWEILLIWTNIVVEEISKIDKLRYLLGKSKRKSCYWL